MDRETIREALEKAPSVLLMMVFQLGRNYEYMWQKAEITDLVDFEAIRHAVKCGGEFKSPSKIGFNNLRVLKDRNKINELNKIAEQYKEIIDAVKIS